MPNSFINFCYGLAGKPEDMEDNQPEQENIRRMKKAMLKREAARKRAMNVKMHNAAVKLEARREVRRPGRDYSRLFQTLDQLLGSVEDKTLVVHDIINEALRFKRRIMAQLLEEYIMELELNENQNCRHCEILRAGSRRSCTCKGRNIG